MSTLLPPETLSEIVVWRNAGLSELRQLSQVTLVAYNLTYVEYLVAKLIAMNLPRKCIASSIGRSHKTIEKHIDSVFHKLKVHTAIELVHWAIVRGVIKPGECVQGV